MKKRPTKKKPPHDPRHIVHIGTYAFKQLQQIVAWHEGKASGTQRAQLERAIEHLWRREHEIPDKGE